MVTSADKGSRRKGTEQSIDHFISIGKGIGGDITFQVSFGFDFRFSSSPPPDQVLLQVINYNKCSVDKRRY